MHATNTSRSILTSNLLTGLKVEFDTAYMPIFGNLISFYFLPQGPGEKASKYFWVTGYGYCRYSKCSTATAFNQFLEKS